MTQAAALDDAALRALLGQLPDLAYAFVLLVARIGSAVMLIPLLGEAEVPAIVRVGFTLLLVVLLMPGLLPLLPAAPDTPLGAAGQVGAEVLSGLFLGWLARLVMVALTTAGQMVSLATGLSNVLQQDPALGTQGAALARTMTVVAPVALLATDLHAWPLAALAGSYRIVPAGTLLPAADTVGAMVAAVGASFGLAVQLAGPFLAATLLFHLALALAARLAASLQPMALAAPVQLLGGLILLALVPAGLLLAWGARATELLVALPGLG